MKDNYSEQLYIRMVEQANAHYLVTALANLLISSILAYNLREVVSPFGLVGWLALMLIIVGLRTFHVYNIRLSTYSHARKIGRIYLFGLTLTGMTWGMIAIFLFPEDSLHHQTLISLVIGGMVISASATTAGLNNAILFFSIPALAPLIVRLFSGGSEIMVSMGLMLLILFFFSAAMSKKIHQLIVGTITSTLDREKEIEVRKNVEEKLQTHQEELEDTITDRTKELYQANIELAEQIQERKKSERKYQDIFNSTTDAMFIHDASSGEVLEVNQTMLEMYGYTDEEVLGVEFEDLCEGVSPYSKSEASEKIRATIDVGPQVFEWKAKKKNQELFWVEVSLKYSEFEDGQYVIAVVRDIETRKRDEENRLKFKKLESIGALAGGIAHDFNNILVGIGGNINLALDDQSVIGETREILIEAEEASLRAKGLSQQLLTFSRGGGPINMVSSLTEVIKDSASFVLRGGKNSCEFSIPDNLYLVDIDRGQISQVIQNIVLNADQAMPGGGTVRIVCTNIVFIDSPETFGSNGKHVKIQISDTGAGISSLNFDRIFDPYFSTKEGNTGLGLAICQSIIARHKGSIAVNSIPDEGTTFTILLPAASLQDAANADVVDLPAEKIGQYKIMVMDDKDEVRNFAKRALTQMGFSVVVAKNGIEAIQFYKDSLDSPAPIDLIIMDLTVQGGMGGTEAAEKVLALNPGAKIVVASGYSKDPVMEKHTEFGFCAAIEKPYFAQDLKRIIFPLLA